MPSKRVSEKSLKGINKIAGGNAPGIAKRLSDPVRVELMHGLFDPYRVGQSLCISGGVAPGYFIRPFQELFRYTLNCKINCRFRFSHLDLPFTLPFDYLNLCSNVRPELESSGIFCPSSFTP